MTDKTTEFKQRHAPMTKTRFKAIIADYAASFPDWGLVHGRLAFVRSYGPIQQIIWFQDMRAYYRPTHGISSLVLPEAHIRMLPQHLDVKHREVEYRWHERKFTDTLAAMEQQFRPDIRKSLDISEVLALCETEAETIPDTTNNMAMVAILSAWLGRDAAALDYCERMQHCPLPTLAPMPEWEGAMRAFGRDLVKAVGAGTAREFLESAVEEAKAR